mmetsp:Transcript_29398/g.47376  ORF Transcript_29398/g.47376 Transcript_29398/m.47376 type:complete len:153 (+) Transcript_29398:10-468(+)
MNDPKQNTQKNTGKQMDWGKFDETLAYLDTVFAQQGPFDGVLGFSQGACVTYVLSALAETGDLPPNIQFKFAVLISGFRPRDSRYSSICTRKIKTVRTLHVVGKSDDVVDSSRSYEVADNFQDPLIVEHDKGHLVPSDKHVRDALKAFMAVT